MASDDRPTDNLTPKRRGKAPTITLEAREVEPTPVVDPSAEVSGAEPQAGTASQESAAATPPAETELQPPPASDAASIDAVAAEAAEARAAAPEVPAEPGPTANTSGEPASSDTTTPDTPVAGTTPPDATPPDMISPAPEQPALQPDDREDSRPAAPPPAGAGFGRLAAAGLIGALITGGAAVGTQLAGYWPAGPRPDTAALEQRLAALDGQVRQIAARPAPSTAPTVDLGPLTRRIEALDAARAGLETRLAAVERRPAAPAAQGSQQPPAVDLAPLKTEIDALKVAVEAVASAQRTAAQAPAAAPAAPAIDMAAVEARVAALLAPQGSRIEAATGRLRALDEEIKATAAAARALGDKVTALETARTQAGDAGRRAALVVGLSSLRAAVDRGLPFAGELKSAAALGLPAEAVRSLEAHAERGLPTSAGLAQRFSALVPALLRAAPSRTTDGTLLDRLTATAQNLVRVRPVGEAAGDDVPTAVARAEAKLRRGDIAGALADIDRLPEPVRALAASWTAEARARVAAETTLRRLTLDATAALTGG